MSNSYISPNVNSEIRFLYTSTPEKKIKNNYFEDYFSNELIEKSSKMTGVEQRFWADKNTTTLDLCVDAAKKMFDDNNFDQNSIDAIVLVTQTPDYQIPASSYIAHKELNLSQNCMAFDVNLGCTGFVYGYYLATSLLNSGLKNILLLAGETSSKTVDIKDQGTSMLFGDAGSATLITSRKKSNDQVFSFKSNGSGYETIIIPSGISRKHKLLKKIKKDKLFMSGPDVFNFTIKEIPDFIKSYCDFCSKNLHSWDFILLHQANLFMLNHIYKKTKVKEEQKHINIQKFGNASSASIPLLISDLGEKLNFDSKILATGFGVGLSWASCNIFFSRDFKSKHINLKNR